MKLLLLLLPIVLSACTVEPSVKPSPSVAEPSINTMAVENWLQDYYSSDPIGGGWTFIGINVRGDRVTAQFDIPATQASRLKSADMGQKLAVTKVACPSPQEAVWKSVGSGKIEMMLSSKDELIFNADCDK